MKCITSVMTAVITAAVGKMQQLDDWRWWCRNNSIIPGHLLAQRAYYTLCILFEYGAFTQPWIKSCCIFIEVVRLSGGCGEIAFVARLITWSEHSDTVKLKMYYSPVLVLPAFVFQTIISWGLLRLPGNNPGQEITTSHDSMWKSHF